MELVTKRTGVKSHGPAVWEGSLSIPTYPFQPLIEHGFFRWILRPLRDNSGYSQIRAATWDLHKRCPCFGHCELFLPQQICVSLFLQSWDNKTGAWANQKRKKKIYAQDLLRSMPIFLGIFKFSIEIRNKNKSFSSGAMRKWIKHLLLWPRMDWELSALMNILSARREQNKQREHLPLLRLLGTKPRLRSAWLCPELAKAATNAALVKVPRQRAGKSFLLRIWWCFIWCLPLCQCCYLWLPTDT